MKEMEKDKEVQRRKEKEAETEEQLTILSWILFSTDLFGSSTKFCIIRYRLFTKKC
jgi:hypothetical protein